MKNSYDSIAWFYDRLAGFVFGRTLINAQRFLINAIPAGATVLIVGGGTGWILEEIARIHPGGLKLVYIDASAKMIEKARMRNFGNNEVAFICKPIEDAGLEGAFDVVLTPFLFDNFTNESLQKIFQAIDTHLVQGGLWLYCDFQNTDVSWQRFVLRIMYWFFRATCGIEANHLPDASSQFVHYGYSAVASATFIQQFIASVIYKKPGQINKQANSFSV